MKKTLFAFFFFLFVALVIVNAQDREVKFEKISVGQGLSHSSVFDIVQDSLGYMWFATQDMQVNRYDGYEFKTFRPDAKKFPEITYQNVRRLLVDHNDGLWMGGNKGICRFDFRNEQFKTYLLLEDNAFISGLVNDESKNIWASTANGKLYLFDQASESFKKINILLGSNNLSTIETIKSKGDLLYIGSRSGLFVFNKKNSALRKIMFDGSANHFIRDIEPDPKNGIWIGTEEDGLYLLSNDYRLIRHYSNVPGLKNSLVNDKIRDIEIGPDDKIWIGTFKGLSILNPDNGYFDNYIEESGYNYSLSQNSIRCIYLDRDKGMWLGTFYGGLSYYHPYNIKFNLINRSSGDPMLNDNVVNVVREDRKHNLWVGTNDHGLDYLDLKNRKATYYENKSADKNVSNSNNIKSILELDDETLLLGTHWGGLIHFYPGSGRFVTYTSASLDNSNSLADDRVTSLLKDHLNTIWVGSFRGLQEFDVRTGKFIPHYVDSKGQRLTSDQISCLSEDSQKRIWIGTNNGLNIFYPGTNVFESFIHVPVDSTSLSSNEITCILEDTKRRIWVGTNNGLNLFDEELRTFKRFNSGNNMIDSSISDILEDKDNNLWISTTKGLMKFNTTNWNCIYFNLQDGIQSTQYNPNAAWRTSDGMLIFGGINGLTMFYPEKIGKSGVNSRVLLSRLLVNNKVVTIGDSTGILKKSIAQTNRIKLKFNQNMISLYFVAINFYNKEKVNYQYRLEGYSTDWSLTHDSRWVSFANLSPGKYVFKVKVNSPYQLHEDYVTSLDIIVSPPWWRSTLAYFLYLLFLSGLGILVYKIIRERIKTSNDLKVERLEKQKQEEVHKMKLQFFTNISHEFKTPLSLIISPLEKMMESKTSNDWYNKQIDIVYKNARRLLSLIDQLLEFRKAEVGKLELRVMRNDLVAFLFDIYGSFVSLAKSRDIEYRFDKDVINLEGYFDKSFLEKIMFNLLSNAFKYTPTSGKIILSVKHLNDEVIISVADSGRGIPKEQLPYVYDTFNNIKQSNPVGGSGIGLAFTKRLVELHHGTIDVESELGIGTKFTVRLPVSKEAFLLTEIYEEVTSDDIIKDDIFITQEADTAYSYDKSQALTKEETILIVDDNQDLVNYLSDNLSKNYNIDVAYDGMEALEKIKDTEYDLIISDVMMPNMDGLNLCRKIKQNIRICHIPVILLTVKASIEQQVEGLEIGADDYLAKPFSLRILESKINNIIKSRKRLKEIYKEGLDIHPDQIAYNALDQEFLQKAVSIVEANLSDENFSVDQFAREMFMSRSNLHLKFKAITGDSASEFIKKIRFRKSVELLHSGKYNISEISYMVGFSSPSYFSNRFRQYFGCLPTDYMKKK